MTATRRDVWTLSAAEPWPDELLWYAKAVRVMQSRDARPPSDPTSWAYQAAVHGLANTAPPPGAPWNQCQHATWYFAPWHRMYLFQFEQICRKAIVSEGGPADWALPYWNYERSPQALVIPPAFTAERMPDGSPNPLRVSLRRQAVNDGQPMPSVVASSSVAMNATVFTSPDTGEAGGFGGPQTGFAHFGPSKGELEKQPHDVVHGWVGGLMNNPDTAALDPIFWLHHANIDRLWETWRIKTDANPVDSSWLKRRFRLRDSGGKLLQMTVDHVVDAQTLDYTYDSLPVIAAEPERRVPMTMPSRSETVARNRDALQVGREGASAALAGGPLPPLAAAAAEDGPMKYYLRLADITGQANPDVIYGVYVNLPDGASEEVREAHRVGLVSFFGIEHSTQWGSNDPQPLSYSFDVTDVMAGESARGRTDAVSVTLLPIEGTVEAPSAAAADAGPVTVGTVALRVAHG